MELPTTSPTKKRKQSNYTSTTPKSPLNGCSYTLSVALPSNIITSAPSHDLKTQLSSQLARALAVFKVDEIILFADGTPPPKSISQLRHILTYLETPPYLRKHLFPIHEDLRSVGLLPPLEIPPHVRADEDSPFREAFTLECVDGQTFCDAGLEKNILVNSVIPVKTRVTLRMQGVEGEYIHAESVAPDTPRLERGCYWGYQVREASSLSAVFTESPFDGGYDLTFGTSETGTSVDDFISSEGDAVPQFRHMLIALGGTGGLGAAAKADEGLKNLGVEDPKELFDYWVNVCPGQGSRTVRTEEALWVALAGLRRVVVEKGVR